MKRWSPSTFYWISPAYLFFKLLCHLDRLLLHRAVYCWLGFTWPCICTWALVLSLNTLSNFVWLAAEGWLFPKVWPCVHLLCIAVQHKRIPGVANCLVISCSLSSSGKHWHLSASWWSQHTFVTPSYVFKITILYFQQNYFCDKVSVIWNFYHHSMVFFLWDILLCTLTIKYVYFVKVVIENSNKENSKMAHSLIKGPEDYQRFFILIGKGTFGLMGKEIQ